MESQPPPVRVIAIGRVYRPDETDETHSPMFHQIEGLMVDRGVTMADLKTVLRLFARSYLGEDVKIRFRPSFFPFTEPSVEVDMLWHGGDRWVEMGGAGMVDPNVFRAVGYDPDEVSGFAFGLGIERLCMRRHGIKDIRSLLPERRAVPRPVLSPGRTLGRPADPAHPPPTDRARRQQPHGRRPRPSDRRRPGRPPRPPRSITATSPRSGPKGRAPGPPRPTWPTS